MRILFVFIEIKESALPVEAALPVTPPSRWEPPLPLPSCFQLFSVSSSFLLNIQK